MNQHETAEKILLFGGVPHEYLDEWEITSDLELVRKKMGVEFECVDHEALVDRYTNATGADRAQTAGIIAKLLADAETNAAQSMPPLSAIEKAVQLYVAMDAMRQARDGDAVSIVCTPWIREPGTPVPCAAVMLLQEAGIPAACQGDLDALLTMVLFGRIGTRTTFMGGVRQTDDRLVVSHCALARTITGSRRQAYAIRDYHGRKAGPTVWTDLPVGETVTLARLTKNLDSLLLTTGIVRGKKELPGACANGIVVEVEEPHRVLDAVRGVQNHYVLAWGDRRQALVTLAEARGIPVVYL